VSCIAPRPGIHVHAVTGNDRYRGLYLADNQLTGSMPDSMDALVELG
jgi:hypothetical protein